VSRAKIRKKSSKPHTKTISRAGKNIPDISWIRTLAAPYLRDYRVSVVNRGGLKGHRFTSPAIGKSKTKAGFFVGYLLATGPREFLSPSPPEAIVFAYLGPVGSPVHEQSVSQQGSLFRKTAEYIGWLTHRPPRFAFFDNREIALVRHTSMAAWPARKHAHFSRNFFIETLAWLVRSGLVAKLRTGIPAISTARDYEKRKD
jgi:hypothetical protein